MESENKELMRSAMLLRSFWSVQKNTMRFIQKRSADNGISVPQYRILMTIFPFKEMTQKTLGEKTFLPKSTLSQSVEGLVQEELLDRQQVEGNRREIQLILTEKGEDFFNKIHLQEGGIHQIFQSIIETLTEKQYQEVLDVHLKIINSLKAETTEQGGMRNDKDS